MASNSNQPEVCIIGLGYVGLPLAEAFAKNLKSRMSWPPILIDITDTVNSKHMEKEGIIYYGI